MFKSIIKSDKRKAHEFFLARQKNYENTKNVILAAGGIGGIVVFVGLSDRYGNGEGAFLFLLIAVSYALGYAYCSAIWNKEMESSNYYSELSEVDREDASGEA